MLVVVYTETKVQMRVFDDAEVMRMFSTLDEDKINEIELNTINECPAVIFDAPGEVLHNVFVERIDAPSTTR